MNISKIHALEILDSRGNPTVESTVILADGSAGSAKIPSGASAGSHEAIELRDHDPKRFSGNGVLKAVDNVNTKIAGVVTGMDAENQQEIDKKMIEVDGTKNKATLGANAILSVSLATARAQANSEKKPLYAYLSKFNPDHKDQYTMPIPQMNIMNGAKHANWATDIQEFIVMPVSASSTREAIRMGAEIYHCLGNELKALGYAITVGDEGGFAPQLQSNEEPFARIVQAIEKAGYVPGKDIFLGIDAAASEFYKDHRYHLNKEGKTLDSDQLIEWYQSLLPKYPIASYEDIFQEDDWKAWRKFTVLKGTVMQIIGDDLYATNRERLNQGIQEHSTNSILIKLNQIGTLTETIEAILLARKNNMTSVVSHRSGETEDPFIADFVVAMGTGQIKTGAPARSERVAKYNRLIQIEKELGEKASYAEFPFFNPGATTL